VARERDQALARAEALDRDLRAAVAAREAGRAEATRLAGEVDQLRPALAAARTAASEATRRAERAEGRLDQLIAALPTPVAPPPPAPPPAD
jgi:predicted  nucleic acid-binding Zn-ribbon protein